MSDPNRTATIVTAAVTALMALVTIGGVWASLNSRVAASEAKIESQSQMFKEMRDEFRSLRQEVVDLIREIERKP